MMRHAIQRASLALLLIIGLLSTSPARAAQGEGTPVGVPSNPPGTVTVVYDEANAPTEVAVSWNAVSDADNGGSAIIGYAATAMTGADFTTATAANCPVGANTTTCTIYGLAYSTQYKIKVVAKNAVGSSTGILSAAFTTKSLPQSVTIGNIPQSPKFGDAPSQMSVNVSSGLTAAWTTSTPTICSVNNAGVVSYLAAGSCTVTATQDGIGTEYAAASDTETFTIGINQTATTVAATAISGTGATLNATVPFAGSEGDIVFCLSTTNSDAACTAPSGAVLAAASPARVTATSAASVTGSVSGLLGNTVYYFWVQVTVNGTVTKGSVLSFTTTVAPALRLTGPTTGQVQSNFSTTLTASQGTGVFTSWSANVLPAGLVLIPNGTEAVISGTPTEAGSTSSTITVTDSANQTAQLAVTFTINAAPPAGSTGGGGAAPSTEDDTSNPEEQAQSADAKDGVVDTPIVDKDGTAPDVPKDGTTTTVAGKALLSVTEVLSGWLLSIRSELQQLQIYVRSPEQQLRDLGSTPVLRTFHNDRIHIAASGFKPGTKVTVFVLSNPIKLGELDVRADGKVDGDLLVTATIAVGNHTLQLNGISTSNKVLSTSIAMQVAAVDGATGSSGDVIAPPTVSVYPFYFSTKGIQLNTPAKKRISTLRALAGVAAIVTCRGYTDAKTTKKAAVARAKTLCKTLFPASIKLKYRTTAAAASAATKVSAKPTKYRPYRVDLLIRRR